MIDECTYLGEHTTACGCPTVEGRSYCADHLWLVYKQGTAITRKKDARTAAAVWDLRAELDSIIEELIEEGMDL
jgi:hypothetical protein